MTAPIAARTAGGGEALERSGVVLGRALRSHLGNGRPSLIVVCAALDPPPTMSSRWYRR
jgi:hypothetical protein